MLLRSLGRAAARSRAAYELDDEPPLYTPRGAAASAEEEHEGKRPPFSYGGLARLVVVLIILAGVVAAISLRCPRRQMKQQERRTAMLVCREARSPTKKVGEGCVGILAEKRPIGRTEWREVDTTAGLDDLDAERERQMALSAWIRPVTTDSYQGAPLARKPPDRRLRL
jgi:hypothetical protein